MPRLVFTANLAAHVECRPESVDGDSVRSALDAYFDRHPEVRSYVLDEQGALRRHVVIFVNGVQARDRRRLSDPVGADAEVYVAQALSGG